jgi:hypothetical protein
MTMANKVLGGAGTVEICYGDRSYTHKNITKKYFYRTTIKNMATVQNFEFISGKTK